jgi:hypothetical protein
MKARAHGKANVISFQIEPRFWPSDIGPIKPATFRKCGVSCAVTFDLNCGRISVYSRNELTALGKVLRAADHVISYNSLRFDQHLLAGSRIQVSKVHWVDLCDLLRKQDHHGTPLSKAVLRINPVLQPMVTSRNHRRWILEQNQTRLVEKCVNDALNIARLFRHLQSQKLPGLGLIRTQRNVFLF